jgi:hypothetical protein
MGYKTVTTAYIEDTQRWSRDVREDKFKGFIYY